MSKNDREQDDEIDEQFYLEMLGASETPVLKAYIDEVANRGLRKYRGKKQWGMKAGQTYYTHILDGITMLARLFDLPDLVRDNIEQRCLLLAFTAHDINKVAGESRQKYVDIATPETIGNELAELGADDFFPDWHIYLPDIVALAQLHQGHLAVTGAGIDLRPKASLRLNSQDPNRVERLGKLIRGVDVLDMSSDLDERKFKGEFLDLLNAASPSQRYRFMTHRVSEYRGVLTNLIHNQFVNVLRDEYPQCLDILYYPDGVAYLIPLGQTVTWSGAQIADLAERVVHRAADLQAGRLDQFIKNRPFGIAVDDAAIESGANAEQILGAIYAIAARKRYGAEREQQREADVRRDLRSVLDKGTLSQDVVARIESILALSEVLSHDENRLRMGEYIIGYRNLIEAHGAALDHAVANSWHDLYQTLGLPVENYPVYEAVNTYRRGFFLVRDISELLTDLNDLHAHFLSVLRPEEETADSDNGTVDAAQVSYLTDYLSHVVQVVPAADSRDFASYLRRYVTGQNRQCSNCSSALQTQEWMTANVPPSISVQNFSNRLVGGSQRDPKRYICPICRLQFILEKIAWVGHASKQGLPKTTASGTKTPGYTTFYLHLYPHTFFTQPFLRSWIAELRYLRDLDTRAFLIDLNRVFRAWNEQEGIGDIPIIPTKLNGIAIPLDDAMSNIPILPINAPGKNYGEQFLLALEKAVVLRQLFGCKVVLSRLPSSPIDANVLESMFVDGLPRNLLWLVAGVTNARRYQYEANLTTEQIDRLEKRLQNLHRLQDELHIPGDDSDLVHDFSVAASDDPWCLYQVIDRAIEAKVAAETRGKARAISPEQRATHLSRIIAPIAQELSESGSS